MDSVSRGSVMQASWVKNKIEGGLKWLEMEKPTLCYDLNAVSSRHGAISYFAQPSL